MSKTLPRRDPVQGPKLPVLLADAIVRAHLQELDAEQDAIAGRIVTARATECPWPGICRAV